MSWTELLWKREPILKRKLILKEAKLVRFISPEGIDIGLDQDTSEIHGDIAEDFKIWNQEVDKLSGDAIGVTGGAGYKGNKPAGKEHFKTLREHLINHVTTGASRKNQDKAGFKKTLEDFKDILSEEKTEIIFEEDVEKVEKIIERLELFNGSKTLDPRNIKFEKVPSGTIKRKGKWEITGYETTYGHYRTPEYVKARKRVYNSTESGVVNSAWFSSERDESQPPMWQAMFANADGVKNASGTFLIKKGLLKICQDFIKEIEKPINFIQLNFATGGGNFNMDTKAGQLANWALLRNWIKKELSKPDTYGGGGSANRVYFTGSDSRILTKLNKKIWNRNQSSSKFLTSIGGLEHLPSHENIKKFQLVLTTPLLTRVMNKLREQGIFESQVKGKPFILPQDGGMKGFLADWGDKMPQNLKPKPKEVKKSWVANLWS